MIVGIDIGGTKCAVATWSAETGLREVARFATRLPALTLKRIESELKRLRLPADAAIGIACGGPLDAQKGIIQSPPNLPGWDEVAIVARLKKSQKRRVFLMNDANANALAESKFGAGEGARLLVYLTAGTGMGAGIVIDGKVLDGVSGSAGEVGHLRLSVEGPTGFHKAGSFEGWCSGGGIPQIVEFLAGQFTPAELAAWGKRFKTTRAIAEAARQGDKIARAIFAESGRRLGEALATIIDLLNPDRIVIGSLYVRCQDLLDETMLPVLRREALPASRQACTIVPAQLGEQTGNLGAVCVALAGIEAEATSPAFSTHERFAALLQRKPALARCLPVIEAVHKAIAQCFKRGHRVYLCGNGGSASDAEHWAGELLKGFYSKRPLSRAARKGLPPDIAAKLQGGLPAIPLTGFTALRTAVANDIDAVQEFAQLVWALGEKGDVLVALSTSGNARNVAAAAQVARAKGMTVVGLTGRNGGTLKTLTDHCIRVPADATHEVQEDHLAIYHALSLAWEDDFFGGTKQAPPSLITV